MFPPGTGSSPMTLKARFSLARVTREDAPLEKVEEMGKVQISLVENDNLTGPNGRAEFAGAVGVVFPRGVDEGEAGQKAVQVQAQMTLGGGLAPTVLGPVQAGGHQLDG